MLTKRITVIGYETRERISGGEPQKIARISNDFSIVIPEW